uniref:Protein IWS1 homolog n=1 Tax=Saccoglossus kowalevskii TaxID=10224 RepID=A0ABM0MXM7_SACKO
MSEDDTAPLKTSRRRRTMSGKRRAVLSDSDEDHELSQISDVKHKAYNFRGRDKQPSYNKGSARAVAKMSLEKQLISSSDDELPKKTHRRTTRPALTLDSDTTPESESDKRAEKEQIHQNEKSQNTSTSQILPSSRKNILTQQDNQCSTLNACKPIDKDNVRSRCITQKTLDGSLSKDAVSRIPSITDDLDSNDDPTSDAQLVDVLDFKQLVNTDSSDSDVVSSRTRKRVKKILVDTDDEEENVTHEE